MLVLKRFRRQSILIGDDIRIEVDRFKGRKVFFSIWAPRRLRIVREEAFDPEAEQSFRCKSDEPAHLVLMRSEGQSLRIGDDVVIHVARVERMYAMGELGQVTVGIEAPGLHVRRLELAVADAAKRGIA